MVPVWTEGSKGRATEAQESGRAARKKLALHEVREGEGRVDLSRWLTATRTDPGGSQPQTPFVATCSTPQTKRARIKKKAASSGAPMGV